MNARRIFVIVSTLALFCALMVGMTQAQAPDPQVRLAQQTSPQASLWTSFSPDAFAAIGTSFTYQGQLKKDGQAINENGQRR